MGNQTPNVSAPSGQDPNQPQGYNANTPRSPWSQDFTPQMNQMLAPYQQMASQFQSPYATMSKNSWLAQNHPQLAGILDNAFLGGAMTPGPQGPEGVGGGISRAMQGLVGANQFRRQQMMQGAMLPFQMMMPQLQAQDMMAQTAARGSQALREQDYHQMITDRYGPGGLAAQKNQMEQDRINAFVNPSMLDHRRAMLKAGLPTTADINTATPEQLEKYNNAFQGFQSERQRPQRGGSVAERMVDDEEQENIKRGMAPFTAQQRNQKTIDYSSQVSGGQAGGRVGAEAGVRTQADVNKFTQDQWSSLEQEAKSHVMSVDAFERQHQLQFMGEPDDTKLQGAYDKYVKDTAGPILAKARTEHAQYKRSTAPSQFVSIDEWRQNPKQYESGARSSGPPASGPSSVVEYDAQGNPK